MTRALVIGASGGIGAALANHLERQGWTVTRLSRRQDGLDITDETTIERALAPLAPGFTRILIATGALEPSGTPPEKSVAAVTADALAAAFAVNATGPMLVLKHALPLLATDRPAVIAALSARVGSIGDNRIGGWHSYRASKAALNQLIRGAAIEMKRTHKQAVAVALHPGTVATPFTAKYAGRHKTTPPDEAAQSLLSVIDSLTPDQSGGFFDYAGNEIPW